MTQSDGLNLTQRVPAWPWLLPLVTITLLIGALSLWAYRLFSAEIRDEAVRTLAGIAEEKRLTIERWLADTDSDARTFFAGTSVTLLLLNEWVAGGRQDEALLDRLRARLEEVALERDWGGLTLYDDQGEPLVEIGDSGSRVPAERVQDLLHRPRLQRLDAQAGADGVWRHGLLVPVGVVGQPPLAVASLTWGLDQALKPVLAHWPIPSDSAGTALIRREGDTVRFLLTQDNRIPAGDQRSFHEWPRLLAVQAAQGQRGIIKGALDYRGVPILGYAAAIAGSPWILIAKIDQQEAEAGVRNLAVALTLATLLALILLNGAVFGLWRWDRQRRAAIVEEREQGLRSQEQRTRTLLDAILASSTDIIFAKDLEGRYLLANHACAANLGLRVEDMLGHSDRELLPPAAAAMLGEVESQVLAGETFVNLEERLVLSGKEGIYLTTKAPLHDSEGVTIGLYGIIRDISERQRQEADLRAAESTAARLQGGQRWKEALDAVGHGVWELDIRGGQLEFSPTIGRLLGLEPAELSFDLDAWLQRQHPDEREAIASALRAALASEHGHYEVRHRVRHRDGNWRWFLSRGLVSERGPDGAPWHMLGTLTDITAWQEAEARLHESEERARRQWIELEAIYTTAPVGLFVLDRDLRFRRLNERLAEMNGLPVAAHLGRRVREIVPDLAEAAEPLFQGVIDRAEPLLNIELSGETGSQPGIRRHWREHYYPMKDESGQVIGINGVVEEITELKRIEAEIRALNADLEAKVEARTAEARAASAAKSEFLAHMSHEIRTPLNAVLGLVQVVEQSPLTPEQRDLIARIRAAGRSLLLILNDILDFSKIEARQLQLESRPFVLGPLFEHLDSLLGSTARAKDLRFAIDAAPLPSGALVGDPLRLEQVLTNLIGNAIKFTGQGEVRLHIRTLEEDENRARLRFEVSDTGIGIAPAILPGIFAAFLQADSGISRRFGGTGLGLAISQRLVELMGGVIGVESQEGVGTTFWFELPFARSAADPAASAAAPAGTATDGPTLAGRHYLIVDDNVLNLDVLEWMLELEGARATRAFDGREALERLRTQADDFDAVLMDVQMPVLDGLSTTRAIRGELGLSQLPVIAVTAGVLKDEQQRAREAGVDDVLPKPVELESLVAVLSRWAPRAPDASDSVTTSAVTLGTVTPGDDSGGSASRGLADPAVAGEGAMAGQRAADPTPSATALPAIAGIDQAHIARLIRGDLPFYRRLLGGLVAEARDVPGQVRADLTQGDLAAAAASLHRLRGAAGNLGALELAAAIRGLEAALKEPLGAAGPRVAACLTEVEAQLMPLLTSAGDWLAHGAPPAPVASAAAAAPPPVAPGPDAAVTTLDLAKLAALRKALAFNRPQPARALFAELRAGLVGCCGAAPVGEMATHLDALDFSSALNILDNAAPAVAVTPNFAPPNH